MVEPYNERLKAIREDRDRTQQEVADFLNISRPQYYLYESGKRELPLHHLKKLCQYFGVSSDYILGLPKGLHWPR